MDRHLNRGRFAAASFLAVALWPLLPGVAAAQAAPHFVSAAPSITIVDMPPDSTPALNVARRPHHALRMRSEMAQNALRSFGVDASECAMLLRVHSKLASTGAGAGSLVVSPQMHLACRF